MSAIVAIIVGIVLIAVFVKLALGILGIGIGLVAAAVVYLFAEKVIGKGK